MRRCDKCLWWSESAETIMVGQCRRYAPAPVWPTVAASARCGDFEDGIDDGTDLLRQLERAAPVLMDTRGGKMPNEKLARALDGKGRDASKAREFGSFTGRVAYEKRVRETLTYGFRMLGMKDSGRAWRLRAEVNDAPHISWSSAVSDSDPGDRILVTVSRRGFRGTDGDFVCWLALDCPHGPEDPFNISQVEA